MPSLCGIWEKVLQRQYQWFQRLFQQPKQRRSRRFLMGMLLGLLVTVGLLGAIAWPGFSTQSGAAAKSDTPIELNLLMHVPEAGQWSGIVEAFDQENPGIKLNVIEGPSATNLIEDLHTSAFILGDSPYDLIYLDIAWVPKFAAAGWLMDLSKEMSEEELAEFLPGDVDGGRYKGGLYRMPFRTDMGMLYYRKDLLDELGIAPPETFADLVSASKRLQEADKTEWGYLWQGKQYEGLAAMVVEIFEGFGGFWVDPTTNAVGLDKPEAIAAVEFLVDAIDEGISPPGTTTYTETETLRFFRNGSAAFLRNWPYVWAEANKPDSPIRGKVGIVPMVHAPGKSSGACQGGWGLGINRFSKHPDEAIAAAKFFAREDIQKQFVMEHSYVASRKSLADDPDVTAKYPQYSQLVEILDSSPVLRPPIAQYAQASDILQRYLTAALTQSMTPEAAMMAAARETRSLLGTEES
ncbi:MAG: ABC transporter substrate-binding protein [Cyanobacteria bacterium P01_D01_bin.73]